MPNIKIPRFSPHKVESRFKRLFMGKRWERADGDPDLDVGLLETWHGADLTSSEAQLGFVDHVSRLLPRSVNTRMLIASCRHLFVHELKEEDLWFWCWRMAAHWEQQLFGNALPEMGTLTEPTWVPLEIIHAGVGWTSGTVLRKGTALQFQVMEGSLCPLQFSRWFSERFLFIMHKDLGLPRRRAPEGYKAKLHRNELVGMRFVAQIEPHQNAPGRITYSRYSGGQFSNHNRKIESERSKPCPYGHNLKCFECPIGRSDIRCNRLDTNGVARPCRPVTLLQSLCTVCAKETWHDRGKCISCRRRPPFRATVVENKDATGSK
jgi:hypothetical protein